VNESVTSLVQFAILDPGAALSFGCYIIVTPVRLALKSTLATREIYTPNMNQLVSVSVLLVAAVALLQIGSVRGLQCYKCFEGQTDRCDDDVTTKAECDAGVNYCKLNQGGHGFIHWTLADCFAGELPQGLDEHHCTWDPVDGKTGHTCFCDKDGCNDPR